MEEIARNHRLAARTCVLKLYFYKPFYWYTTDRNSKHYIYR